MALLVLLCAFLWHPFCFVFRLNVCAMNAALVFWHIRVLVVFYFTHALLAVSFVLGGGYGDLVSFLWV